jgi:hypothetical protein
MNTHWGSWNDPDTEKGIQAYESAGLVLSTPADISSMTPESRLDFSRSCAVLLDEVYTGNYPSDNSDIAKLSSDIESGDTFMFTLSDADDSVVAMASLIKRRNTMNGPIGLIEMSKACKHPELGGVAVRHLLKHGISWALQNIPDADFVYGSARAAADGIEGVPSGKGIQSIWWGGRAHGLDLPFISSSFGWSFKMDGIEPLDGLVFPVAVEQWAKQVQELPLYVSDEEEKALISTLFSEATDGSITPNIVVSRETHATDYDLRLLQARPSMEDIISKYVVSDSAPHLVQRSVEEVNGELFATISQKTIIETDVASTPKGAAIMRQLKKQGWTFAGWQPSEVVSGGVCPVLARVNPDRINELVPAQHHVEYFQNRLQSTRTIIDSIYSSIKQSAIDKRKI